MAATDFKDYYAILGVDKTASADEIKRVFRKLARQYHPDMNPGDRAAEARFKEISEAYEVLSDTEKRQKYDQFGRYWKQADQGGWPGGAGVNMGDFNNLDFDFSRYGSFDEFINELLGRMGGAGGATGGRSYYRNPSGGAGFSGFSGFDGAQSTATSSALDREANITLSFGEAFSGVQKRLSLGSETIDVRIPIGVKQGTRMRVRGKGQATPYGQRGDLYLNIQIQPHGFFQLEGDNLVCEVPILPDEAVLGAQIEVPTPDGSVTVNVPAGVRSGQSLRLRGKGWPKPGGQRGDQLVRVAIAPPKDLSTTERELYEKIRASRTSDPRAHLKQIHL